MGRTGTAGGITRASARLSNTPELLAEELNGILPDGVEETDTEFIFNGIRLNKNGLRELEGKLYSNNPFEIKFYDEFGKEYNDTYYKKHGDYIPAFAFTFDPETNVLTLDGNRAALGITRWTEHAKQVINYGERKNYDVSVKGWYNVDRNSLGIATDRHYPRRRGRYSWTEELEVNRWNMVFDSLKSIKRFFSLDTKVFVGNWEAVENEVKYGGGPRDLSSLYTEFKIGEV